MQENIFLAGLTVLLPSQICMCRCFFLELPRHRAIFWTVLNIFVITIWPNITKAAYGWTATNPLCRARQNTSRNGVGLPQLSTSQQDRNHACECLHLLADNLSAAKGQKSVVSKINVPGTPLEAETYNRTVDYFISMSMCPFILIQEKN